MSKAKEKKSTKVKMYVAVGHDGYSSVGGFGDTKKEAVDNLDSDFGVLAEKVLVVEVDKASTKRYEAIPLIEVK